MRSLLSAVSSTSGIILVNASLVAGWRGFDYYRHPLQTTVAAILTAEVLAAAWLESAAVRETWVPRQSWVFLFAPFWLLMNFAMSAHARLHAVQSSSIPWLGVLVLLSGVLLRIWAARTLGEFFSLHVTVAQGQRLVQSGPYSVCRHPAYLGTLLELAGLSLAFRAPFGVVGLALFAAALCWRVRDEEMLLGTAFGPAYAEYRADVPMLLPVAGRRTGALPCR